MRKAAALALLLVLASIAAPAVAGVAGLAITHEFVAPKFGPLNVGPYAGERGQVYIWSSNASMVRDPSCTSNKGLQLDATTQVQEARLMFAQNEKRGVIETKVDMGVERTDVRGMEIDAMSAKTNDLQPVFQFLPGGKIWVLGQDLQVDYLNIWQNNCAIGEDRRVTVKVFFNMEDKVVTAQVFTRTGGNLNQFDFGPAPMNTVIATEGIDKFRIYVPGGSGKAYADGMVCTQAFEPPMPSQTGGSMSW